MSVTNHMPLILASASPRRRELLARLCPRFEVRPCPLPEPVRRSERVAPQAWAEALAYFKARAVAEQHPAACVLGADTIVVCEGRVLGKPADLDDARRMLKLQARSASDVITGVCVLGGRPRGRWSGAAVTRVWMRDDSAEREAYLRTGDWAGKAGAYGIQDIGDRLVERYEGSFSNVVGLPLGLVAQLLERAGVALGGPAPGPEA